MASASAQNASEIVAKLEEFFTSPEFTLAVGDFMGQHAGELEFVDLEMEQPLKNHDIYTKYTALVERLLDDFVKSKGLSVDQVYEACQRASESAEAGSYMCLDYLLASTEYDSFMELAYDHVQIANYTPSGPLTEMWDPAEEAADDDGDEPEPVGIDGPVDGEVEIKE